MKKEAKETVEKAKTKKKTIAAETKKKESIKQEGKKETVKKNGNQNKKAKQKNLKKENLLKRLWNFLGDVKTEMKKVHFPNRKDMIKYSIATLSFIVFFSLFFYLIDIIFALIRSIV